MPSTSDSPRDMIEWLHADCDKPAAVDLRPITVHECACGSAWFRLLAWFDEGEIGGYLTDMECAACGTLYHAPHPESAEIAEVEYE